MTQQEMIAQCLNGDREPYCSGCGAHSSRNGECCFGVRHEYNHEDCNYCVLRIDCAALTHAQERQAYQPRQVIRPTGPRVVYPQNIPVNRTQPAHIMTRYENPTPIAQPVKEEVVEPWYRRLIRLFFHGAGEGAVEALLHWFRQTRPR